MKKRLRAGMSVKEYLEAKESELEMFLKFEGRLSRSPLPVRLAKPEELNRLPRQFQQNNSPDVLAVFRTNEATGGGFNSLMQARANGQKRYK